MVPTLLNGEDMYKSQSLSPQDRLTLCPPTLSAMLVVVRLQELFDPTFYLFLLLH
jgi:hypothetical protein